MRVVTSSLRVAPRVSGTDLPGNQSGSRRLSNRHKISKWITHGIIKSIKYRDKLYKKLKMTHHESPDFIILKVNLKSFNTLLKKLYVQQNICTMSLLLLKKIRPILGTHGKP